MDAVGHHETLATQIQDSLLLPEIAIATVSTFCAGFPALIPTGQHEEDKTEPVVTEGCIIREETELREPTFL